MFSKDNTRRRRIMLKYRKFISCVVAFAVIISFTILPERKAFASSVIRLAGQDRYETAITISKGGWQTSDNVVLATGNDFPDALCAAPLAKQLNAPIILSDKTYLSSKILSELDRLKAKNVYIIGGEGVISKSIENALIQKQINVVRLYGNDRYETSLKVADYMASRFTMSKEIAVATGEDFPDALSIASIAAKKNMPILLSPKAALPDNIKTYVQQKGIIKSYIIGGTGVISDSVMRPLPGAERIGGVDRFATNTQVLNKFENELNFEKAYISTGNDFPDALAGSALAAKTSSPIILMDKTVSNMTKDYINRMFPLIKQFGVLGGEGVVPSSALQEINPEISVNGNTQGNLNNFGFVAKQGDYIYYSNNSLYKSKVDGSEKMVLIYDTPSFINVCGDWVYYINATTGSPDANKIYKIKTDGTGKAKVLDDISIFMILSGDYIYYSNSSDGGRLYRIKTDGTEKAKLSDDVAYEINVLGDWVYYSSGTNEKILCKVKIDGSYKTFIGSGNFEFINISGDWIYFQDTEGMNSESVKLYKMRTDGSGKVKISDDAPYFINVHGDWIYYSNDSDGGNLYKIKADGSQRTRINSEESLLVNIAGDWIYYATASDEQMIKIKNDGTGRQIVQ